MKGIGGLTALRRDVFVFDAETLARRPYQACCGCGGWVSKEPGSAQKFIVIEDERLSAES